MTFRTPQGMARWRCGQMSMSDDVLHPIGHDVMALR